MGKSPNEKARNMIRHRKVRLSITIVAMLVLPPTIWPQQTAGPAQTASATSNGPSLDDTLTFIRKALDQYGRDYSREPFQETITYKVSSVNGCVVMFTVSDFITPDGESTTPSALSSTTPARIDLSAIDPGSGKVTGPLGGWSSYRVLFNGTDAVESVLDIPVSRQDMANRLIKAFSHTATLCGGKPSAF